MSARRAADKFAPRHRRSLPRARKSLRLELRLSIYAHLVALAEDGESMVEIVEQLIEARARLNKRRCQVV